MQNTLVRGASVCSSCVLNAKRGSILQTVIDCLFVKLLMLCVGQYSVVLPGSCLEMCKNRVSWTALWLLVALQPVLLSLSCPWPSCYAMTSSSSRPVASTPSGTQRPYHPFLCKRLEAEACQSSFGKLLFSKAWYSESLYSWSLLAPGRMNTVETEVQTLSLVSRFPLCWPHLCPAQSQGWGVEDTKCEMQLSMIVLLTVRAMSFF